MMIAVHQLKIIPKKDDSIETPPVLFLKPPAKKFYRSLRNKQTAANYNKDLRNAGDEFVLGNTEWQNASSRSNDCESLSNFSDMDKSSDAPD